MTLQQIFIGVGYALGPVVGGFLFRIGGYRFPFIIIGLFDLSFIALKFSI